MLQETLFLLTRYMCMRHILGKLVLLRVSVEFELPRVRVIGVQQYVAQPQL